MRVFLIYEKHPELRGLDKVKKMIKKTIFRTPFGILSRPN
jgi:hypothetical protein